MRTGRPPLPRPPYRFLPGNIVEIPLTQGKVTLVDLIDLPQVAGRAWYAKRCGKRWWYAARTAGKGFVYMQAVLCPAVEEVDHRNGDGLDNRRQNLRPATNTENSRNRAYRGGTRSGYKGVHINCNGRRWTAHINYDGAMHHIGTFDTPEEAARAYDASALEHFGEFARLNFPRPHLVKKA